MKQEKPRLRRLPFAETGPTADVHEEINERVKRRTSALREDFMSSSNVYMLKHGRRWQTMHASDPEEPSETRLHSTEISISVERIVAHDLSQLSAFLTGVSDSMHGAFMRSMVEVIEDSTKQSGNVVSIKGFKDAFEEMLSKIEFGVDRYGVPSRPQALVPPGVGRQIMELQKTPDADYEKRIAAITDRKMSEATANEARRISRYRSDD